MALNIDRLGQDTIAAIATGMTEAGIGIVRISGPEAFDCIGRIFRLSNGHPARIDDWKGNTIHYGNIVNPDEIDENGNEAVIDEVLVSIYRAPHSYTTEDSIEINTHGGIYLMQRILQLVLEQGVRMAEPGEFTKRAFLGGRIDLTRAEAVMDLISSQNEFSRKSAMKQLKGSVADKIRELRDRILYEIAFIESALDDPENYDTTGYPEKLHSICESLCMELNRLIQVSQSGRILRDGIRTVIIGRPNAGKSSLMNVLLGEERAIVTNIAGTTRDTLEESARLVGTQGEIVLHLIDTAGIHETSDLVEQIGIQRAESAMNQAALILFVIDRSSCIADEDRLIANRLIQSMREDPQQRCLVILNKSDLDEVVQEEDVRNLFATADDILSRMTYCSISLMEEQSKSILQENIEQMFYVGELRDHSEVLLSSVREVREATTARDSINQVIRSIDLGMSEDFYSSDLMDAYTALGRIIGESVEDDLVEEIFTRFCLGK